MVFSRGKESLQFYLEQLKKRENSNLRQRTKKPIGTANWQSRIKKGTQKIMNKQKFLEKLKNREYREAYVSDHIDMGISLQMKTMREQHGYSQKKLGDLAGMKQEAIARLESPDYEKLNTLKRLAAAFDVGLIVRFVPFGELMNWKFSPDTFKVPSFDDDPCFKEMEGGKAQDKDAYPLQIQYLLSEDHRLGVYEGAEFYISNTGVRKTVPTSQLGQQGANSFWVNQCNKCNKLYRRLNATSFY